jgi:hypothetical protein
MHDKSTSFLPYSLGTSYRLRSGERFTPARQRAMEIRRQHDPNP